jgi:antibiotic biosynthesis monooxygenase (ABM) superfamily enzyme
MNGKELSRPHYGKNMCCCSDKQLFFLMRVISLAVLYVQALHVCGLVAWNLDKTEPRKNSQWKLMLLCIWEINEIKNIKQKL